MVKLPQAFLGKSGQCYFLRNEVTGIVDVIPKYARRASILHHNNKIGWPIYVSSQEAMADFDREIQVDPTTLKVLVD